ncbi:MAG: hypothetical protein FJX34_00705 [Alphaproteobacteria bacterium]|nr:hypothetical protein [Alphaproteobacteria bacterium]
MQSCVVVIPVYKNITDPKEIASLKQGLKIFGAHDIVFICPESFDDQQLKEYLKLHSKLRFEKFSNQDFSSVKSYNSLLLDRRFYARFAAYKFMLIYQLDAYVFDDQLTHWCNRGFDYIGAPWFKDFNASGRENEFMLNAGNGGFSLRNITKINNLLITILTPHQTMALCKSLQKARCKPHNKLCFWIGFFTKALLMKHSFAELCGYITNKTACTNEDYFLAYIYPQIFHEFHVAKAEEAIAFSFECQPEKLYALNKNKLPFGCHAWSKYSPDFWKKFISL